MEVSVYVDWIADPELVRSDVTKQSSEKLRMRMRQCDGMFYLWTEKAGDSRWMPWELGYFDALRGKIAVLPVLASAGSTFNGTEFVGLYPTVEVSQIGGKGIVQVSGLASRSWLKPTQTLRLRG